MHRFFLFLFFFCLLFSPLEGWSCGFGFIGNCSTGISLNINGTLDSFELAPCPDFKSFDGLNLGLIQSLQLAKASGITWESCQNNVTGFTLKFNVHKLSDAPGAWQSFSLQLDHHVLDGPYDTRYHLGSGSVDLVAGLAVGQDYVLEVYFEALVDTLGNDNIPETVLLQNNNGKNYKMRFRYDGAGAPPFTVVNTLLQHEPCNGDHKGRVGVSVYGNQQNLFYQWSNINTNFYAQYDLPAGMYTVTVSGVNGYTQSLTMQILEPPALDWGVDKTQIGGYCNQFPATIALTAFTGLAYIKNWAWFVNGILVGSNPVYNYELTGPPPYPSVVTQVTDQNGCTFSVTTEITLLPYPELNLFLTYNECSAPGSNDGNISVLALGGFPPYAYSWSNGSTEDHLNNLAPGTYCLTLTDKLGCTRTNCATITEPVRVLDPKIQMHLTIQPMPAKAGSRVMIRGAEHFLSNKSAVMLNVFNEAGALVATLQYDWVPGMPFSFEVPESIVPGVYYLRLVSGDQVAIERMLID